MSAVTEAADRIDRYFIGQMSPDLALVLQAARERDATLSEMNARELHHFESEQAMSEALGVLRAASVPPGMTEAQFYQALIGKAARILREATK